MRFGQAENWEDRLVIEAYRPNLPCCPPSPVRRGGRIAPAMPTVPCKQCPPDHGCPAIAMTCPDGSSTGYEWTPQGCKMIPCSSRPKQCCDKGIDCDPSLCKHWPFIPPINWLSQINQNVLYIAVGAIIYLLWVKR